MSYLRKNISVVLEVKLTPSSTTDVTHRKSSLKCTSPLIADIIGATRDSAFLAS